MADPYTRSVSYSALPVFSGDYLAPAPSGELLAPRLSGIPLLVSARPRHVSAHVPQTRAPPPAMPKSQSLRVIPRISQPQAQVQAHPQVQGHPQGHPQAHPHPQSQTHAQPHSQAINRPSLRTRPKHALRPAPAAQTAPTTTAAATPRMTRAVSLKTIPREMPRQRPATTPKAAPAPSKAPAKAPSMVPACATVTTAASAAKQVSRSESLRSIKRGSARAVSDTQSRAAAPAVPPAPATKTLKKPPPKHTQSPKRAPPQQRLPPSESVPFNLSKRNALPKRPPKLDLSRLKQAEGPSTPTSSSHSSRSSRSSFTEATHRFFERIRSSASSRSSLRGAGTPNESGFPMPPMLVDEWDSVAIEREPDAASVGELARLSRPFDSSIVVEDAFKRPPQQGLALSKTGPNLTRNERLEILNYQAVYFSGKQGIQKVTGNFTDDQGNYRSVLDDHIAYRYQIVAELGKGSFGKVFKAKDHKTGRSVALKITCNRAEMRQQARVEARLLQVLHKAGQPDKHHFLRYISSFTFRDHFCICTEILGDNLYDLLKRNKYKGLGAPLVQYITRQLVEGLQFLDLQGMIHCDLKPENILVSDLDHCQVKIIDFGSGCMEDKRIYTYIQSRFYRAPEILLGVPYSTAIDMWSLGCIVPELLRGKPIFPGEDEGDQIACLCETIGAPDEVTLRSCSRASMFFDSRGSLINRKKRGPPGSRPLQSLLDPVAADFCSKLLQWSPQKRLSAGGALFHEFILGV